MKMDPINPLISVVIPTYNHGQFIEEAIESVLAQTYKNLEVIVIDDGSTDNTRQALEKYNKEINYIYQKNIGVSSARNRGISVAKGELIAFLDSDDAWLPEKLELQADLMSENKSISLVACGVYITDYLGGIKREWTPKNPLTHTEFLGQLRIRNDFINSSSALVRRECFKRIGGFDESLQFGEDWDMWLRIAKYYEMRFVEKPLVKIRKHSNLRSYSKVEIIKTDIKKIIKNNLVQEEEIRRKAYSYLYTDLAGLCLSENRKLVGAIYALKALWLHPFVLFEGDYRIPLFFRLILPSFLYKQARKIKGKILSSAV